MGETFEFKRNHSFEKRIAESQKILKKYLDRVPIICEAAPSCKIPRIDGSKFIVPRNLTLMQFMGVIRKRISQLHPSKAIFILVHGRIIRMDIFISELYETHADEDGFLYMMYKDEEVFGAN